MRRSFAAEPNRVPPRPRQARETNTESLVWCEACSTAAHGASLVRTGPPSGTAVGVVRIATTGGSPASSARIIGSSRVVALWRSSDQGSQAFVLIAGLVRIATAGCIRASIGFTVEATSVHGARLLRSTCVLAGLLERLGGGHGLGTGTGAARRVVSTGILKRQCGWDPYPALSRIAGLVAGILEGDSGGNLNRATASGHKIQRAWRKARLTVETYVEIEVICRIEHGWWTRKNSRIVIVPLDDVKKIEVLALTATRYHNA